MTVAASPPQVVVCADYRGHQTRHRRDAGGWVCDVCSRAPEQLTTWEASATRSERRRRR